MPQQSVQQVERASANIETAVGTVQASFAPPQPIWSELQIHKPPAPRESVAQAVLECTASIFQDFSGSPLGLSARDASLFGTAEIPTQELVMHTTARIYLPLLRKSERPEVTIPKASITGLVRSFGDALELYRRALSAAHVTAFSFDQRKECPPDEDLEGRDPRW